MSIFHLNKKQTERLFKRLNAQDIWLESLETYLDKKSVKSHSGYAPTYVYVSEKRDGLEPNTLVKYNTDYIRSNGDQPIYGNLVFAYGDKTYAKLPQHLKLSDAQADLITFASAYPQPEADADDDDDVPTFPEGANVPDIPTHNFKACDVDGLVWNFNRTEDKWERCPTLVEVRATMGDQTRILFVERKRLGL